MCGRAFGWWWRFGGGGTSSNCEASNLVLSPDRQCRVGSITAVRRDQSFELSEINSI
jgi:hypothetical protein